MLFWYYIFHSESSFATIFTVNLGLLRIQAQAGKVQTNCLKWPEQWNMDNAWFGMQSPVFNWSLAASFHVLLRRVHVTQLVITRNSSINNYIIDGQQYKCKCGTEHNPVKTCLKLVQPWRECVIDTCSGEQRFTPNMLICWQLEIHINRHRSFMVKWSESSSHLGILKTNLGVQIFSRNITTPFEHRTCCYEQHVRFPNGMVQMI